MDHLICIYFGEAQITCGRYISTTDASGDNAWEPFNNVEKPVLHSRDIGYRTCVRKDVKVGDDEFEGRPEQVEVFTVGTLVPIEEYFTSLPEEKNTEAFRRSYTAAGVAHAVLLPSGRMVPYNKNQHGTVVAEDTVTRR